MKPKPNRKFGPARSVMFFWLGSETADTAEAVLGHVPSVPQGSLACGRGTDQVQMTEPMVTVASGT